MYIFTLDDLLSGPWLNILEILALFSVFFGILTLITLNPVISVLFLMLLFASVACYLILIGVRFIGLSYLLVYVGAVSILFLFILMLIDIRVSELISHANNDIPLALLSILWYTVIFTTTMPEISGDLNIFEEDVSTDLEYIFNPESIEYIFNIESIEFVTSVNWDGNLLDNTDISSIGNIMYTSYCLWLLITSIILLLAMVGAIVITKRKH